MKRSQRFLALLIPALWLALLAAPALQGGLPGFLSSFPRMLSHPFSIRLCRATPACLAAAAGASALAAGLSETGHFTGKEYGSAAWGDPGRIRRIYADPIPENNKILTQRVCISLDTRRHGRNTNVLVIGGSGSGKSRSYALVNLLQCENSSYFVLDPKRELLQSAGRCLRQHGFAVQEFNLLHFEKSLCYNPFFYLRDEKDVQRLVTNLFRATTPKGSRSSDPFWDSAASMLLMALMLYLRTECPPEDQNFSNVMRLLREAGSMNEETGGRSPLDELFADLARRSPEALAVKYYRNYRAGPARTLKSIQLTLASRLDKFNLESLAALTQTDELCLQNLGLRRTALFAVIPDSDTSFNFLISMLYTQTFQQLFALADSRPDGTLPVPVHFLMDEFANISLPDDFDKILATMRSRGISASIILQNLSQLKALYEKQWQSIAGNCDCFLYLGGNEQETHRYVSEMLGKATIPTRSSVRNRGSGGGSSSSRQRVGRSLLLPDEVRKLPRSDCLLLIRGEKPVRDRKYDPRRHPSYALTPEAGAPAYGSQEENRSSGSMQLIRRREGQTAREWNLPAPSEDDDTALYTEQTLAAALAAEHRKEESCIDR